MRPASHTTESAPRLPDRIVGVLLRGIFRGELEPGNRLPPLRDLAAKLGVDITSLRIAVNHLRQMNLLSVARGAGTIVKDFREAAGVEFLGAVFAEPESPDDPALLLQMLEFQTALVPGLIELAAERVSEDHGAALAATYARILERIDDRDAVARLMVEGEDLVARAADNLVAIALYRSTRPLRLRLAHLVLDTIDARRHFEIQREMLDAVLHGATTPGGIGTRYRDYQAEFTAKVRGRLTALAAA